MTVRAILSRKGNDVITIEPTVTLSAAVKTLAEHRIGAVVVVGPDAQVAGILSERDSPLARASAPTSRSSASSATANRQR